MSFTVDDVRFGRLCNQIFRNLALSIIAQKHNLYVHYSNYDTITNLGITLYIGEKSYIDTITLTDDNYFYILSAENIICNLDANSSYFQTNTISNFLYDHIINVCKLNIKNMNPFKLRYENNNDLCVHFRLTDVSKFNPGIEYYIKATEQLPEKPNLIYICTDEPTHPYIIQYIEKYPNSLIIHETPSRTIQLGSTCKYIILSHGSFSAIIGYLGFHSTIYYPPFEENKLKWCGDMFSIPGWKCVL